MARSMTLRARTPGGTDYELSGPTSAPLVVLIHGLGLNRGIWRDCQPVLAERFRVLGYDLWFHGDSAPGPAAPTLALFAEQLAELLDHTGHRQGALVGFSLGGMINRRMAIDYPERVSALAVLNSPHERSPEQQRNVEVRAAESAAGGPGANLDQTIERWFTPGFRAAHPEPIDRVRRWVLANEPKTYALCRMVLAKGVIELIRPMPPIGKPALVMTCEHDSGSTPAMSHVIAAEIAGSQTVIIPRLQHMGLVEEPALFLEPIERFLDKTLC